MNDWDKTVIASAVLLVCMGIAFGAILLGCGPSNGRATGPRARPDLHFANCASWCPATARHLQQHVQKPR